MTETSIQDRINRLYNIKSDEHALSIYADDITCQIDFICETVCIIKCKISDQNTTDILNYANAITSTLAMLGSAYLAIHQDALYVLRIISFQGMNDEIMQGTINSHIKSVKSIIEHIAVIKSDD